MFAQPKCEVHEIAPFGIWICITKHVPSAKIGHMMLM